MDPKDIVIENDVKYRRRRKKTITGLLLISVILISVGVSLIKKEISTNKKEMTSTRKTEVEFTLTELERYVNYISPVDSIGPSAKLYNDSSVRAKDLSAKERIEYIGYAIYDTHTTTQDKEYTILSEENIRNLVEKVYGPGTYQRTEFNLGSSTYTFSEADGNYYAKVAWESPYSFSVKNKIIDYYATKERLEITTAYAFYHVTAKKIYQDYEKTILLDNFITETKVDPNNYLNDYILNNKDNLNHIIYIFESSDGIHYYFKEFSNEKIK